MLDVYTTPTVSEEAGWVLGLLQQQGIPYVHMVDTKSVMTLSKGNVSPSGMFVVVTKNDDVMKSIFDVCKWIEAEGLKRC